jgi:hypothetical protein
MGQTKRMPTNAAIAIDGPSHDGANFRRTKSWSNGSFDRDRLMMLFRVSAAVTLLASIILRLFSKWPNRTFPQDLPQTAFNLKKRDTRANNAEAPLAP